MQRTQFEWKRAQDKLDEIEREENRIITPGVDLTEARMLQVSIDGLAKENQKLHDQIADLTATVVNQKVKLDEYWQKEIKERIERNNALAKKQQTEN